MLASYEPLNGFDLFCSSCLSISLIEPGPVITEFESKVYEEGLKTDLSKADEVTADMFSNMYLRNFKQIFESLGQTAEDVAEVYNHRMCFASSFLT